jgi:hypothetical protein
MPAWKDFIIGNDTYDLSHLNYTTFDVTRPSTEASPEKQVSFFMAFSDHCFTDHFGPSEDWIYPHSKSQDRYFCPTRYGYSKHLPTIIPNLINTNPYVGRSFIQHREQFFHIDHYTVGATYRIFFEINQNKSQGATTDLRINIVSAYEPRAGQPAVPQNGSFKMWQIIDAKMNGIDLPKKKRR